MRCRSATTLILLQNFPEFPFKANERHVRRNVGGSGEIFLFYHLAPFHRTKFGGFSISCKPRTLFNKHHFVDDLSSGSPKAKTAESSDPAVPNFQL